MLFCVSFTASVSDFILYLYSEIHVVGHTQDMIVILHEYIYEGACIIYTQSYL